MSEADASPLRVHWRQLVPNQVADVTILEYLHRLEQVATPYPWSLRNYQDALQNQQPIWLAMQKNAKNEFLLEANSIIGFFVMLPVLDELELLNIVVSQPYQGQGWGRVLLHKLQSEAEMLGGQRILLEVRASNTPALRLYQGNGFVIDGRRRGYYPCQGGREDALLLSRLL